MNLQEIIDAIHEEWKKKFDEMSDDINKLKKVSDGSKIYVPINDVFDVLDKYKSDMRGKSLKQELKCENCNYWKDSDGEYRRGCEAESKCPINRKEVYEGTGFCYLFESKSEGT